MATAVTIADVEEAAARIRGIATVYVPRWTTRSMDPVRRPAQLGPACVARPAHSTSSPRPVVLSPRTPTLTSHTLDALSGRQLFFKCENLQRVGAFKFRGACNAVRKLSDAEASKGVVTHSSGNHAQALALAARMRGIPAYIVMPSNAPQVKKAAVQGYGGIITECVPTLAARETTANEIIARTGATFVHPFNNVNVIAGQGTLMLELIDQVAALGVASLDAVIGTWPPRRWPALARAFAMRLGLGRADSPLGRLALTARARSTPTAPWP